MGTDTAGTAVGKGFGFATAAKVIAVKGKFLRDQRTRKRLRLPSVLSDQGSGNTSDVIAGVNYAYEQFKASGRPSIATMSLGGTALPGSALDTAVQKAIEGGLHFTVAAGNSGAPADMTSPAHVKTANTIGAVDSNNNRASFSNFGDDIDVWAPGVDITSAWIGSPDANNTISGTSMAT